MGSVIQIKKYDIETKTVFITCECNAEIVHVMKEEIEFMEEFGEHRNLAVECSTCNLLHFLNMNLPIGDYTEVELEETVMPFQDIHNRQVLRDIMWDRRKDLRGKDRAEFNKRNKEHLDNWNAKKQELIQNLQQQGISIE